jgi:hypothetical protein
LQDPNADDGQAHPAWPSFLIQVQSGGRSLIDNRELAAEVKLIHDTACVDNHTQRKRKYCGYLVLNIQYFDIYTIFTLLTVIEKTLIPKSNYLQ